MAYPRIILERTSEDDLENRGIPSFIEPQPPLILNPFMRPKPVKATNLLSLFEDESEYEEPELLQVYLRLKPCTAPSNLYDVKSDRCLITSTDTATAGHGRRTQHNVSKMYTFSKIFGADTTQKEIFENVVKENLRKLSEGHNYTLLTYGASGSGKTYTLMGTVAAPGLVPRSLEYLFKVVEAAQQPLCKPSENGVVKVNHTDQEVELRFIKNLRNVPAPARDKYRRMSVSLQTEFAASTSDLSNRTQYYVWVSFVEIYNEGLYDLLAPCGRRTASSLQIREDSNGLAYVKGANQVFVRSGEEAYDVMVAGKNNLQVAATGVHARSSRSHCIFTITLLTQTETGEVHTSCVRLCDLAGSERAGHTRNTGTRMQESRSINSSLHVLERCLHTLRRKQRQTHTTNLVPFRESKLTRLLGSGLSGARGEAVSMVVTINPEPKFVNETRHVLQLAAVAKDIQVNNTLAFPETTYFDSTQDTTSAVALELMQLREAVNRLEFELEQARSCNRQLHQTLNNTQQRSVEEKLDLVNEAKANAKIYYEQLLAAAERRRCREIQDLTEEYEIRLQNKNDNYGTPKQLKLVAALQKENAVLKEQLNTERMAREEEVEHLRACIEERDLKTNREPEDEEVMSISDDDVEEDPLNESMEPMFIKRNNALSKIVEAEVIKTNVSTEKNENTNFTSIDDENVSCCDTVNDITVSEESAQTYNFGEQSYDESLIDKVKVSDQSNSESVIAKSIDHKRGTYSVADVDMGDTADSNSKTNKDSKEVTDFLIEEVGIESKTDYCLVDDKVNISLKGDKICTVRKAPLLKLKELSTYRNTVQSRESLALFEQYEKKISSCDEPEPVKKQHGDLFSKLKILKEKRTYFDDLDTENKLVVSENKPTVEKDGVLSEKKTYLGDVSTNADKCVVEELVLSKSKSFLDVDIVQEKNDGSIEDTIASKSLSDNEDGCSKSKSDFGDDSLSIKFKESEKSIRKVLDSGELVLSKSKSFVGVDKKQDKNDRSLEDTIASKSSIDKEDGCSKSNNDFGDDSFNIKFKESEKSIRKLLDSKKSEHESTSRTSSEDFHQVSPTFKLFKKKKTFFDNIDVNIKTNKMKVPDLTNKSTNEMENVGDIDKIPNDYELTTIKKLLDDSKSSNTNLLSTMNTKLLSKAHDSMDLFEELNIQKSKARESADLDNIQKFLGKISLADASKPEPKEEKEEPKEELKNEDIFKVPQTMDATFNLEISSASRKCDNTEIEFDNLHNDISKSLAAEFDLLLSKDMNNTSQFENLINKEKAIDLSAKEEDKKKNQTEDTKSSKYNLRHRVPSESDDNDPKSKEIKPIGSKPRKILRLRRQKAVGEVSKDNGEKPSEKFKEILNLQKKFSDVTMNIPVIEKVVEDIPSPEKKDGDENVPPSMESQSCSTQSLTRSRRKLFTPRAEPLEESFSQTDDSNEQTKIHVPRPSYHRGRARRKL